MSMTPTTTTTGITSESHHHRGRRLKHFLLPDGKKVHIALSPEEAESLRKRLETIHKDEPFDLVISGSPEHLDALRQAHTHHEERRENLRTKHGEAYDEFENVRAELDALGSELHMLTDHSVSLDANFSKYGYSAHLRTYDDHSTPGSSANSIHSSDTHEKKDWEAERRNGRIMKLYKKVGSSTLLMGRVTDGLFSQLSDNTFIRDSCGEHLIRRRLHLLNFSWICYMLESWPLMVTTLLMTLPETNYYDLLSLLL